MMNNIKKILSKYAPLDLIPLSLFLHIKRMYKGLGWGNFKDPQTFSEKLCKKNILDHQKKDNKITITSDKYLVRKYVEEKIGSEYLNELYGVFDSPWDIDLSELPENFVVKCTHGSGWNIVNEKITKRHLEQLDKWLHSSYYRLGREYGYKNSKPRIIVEKYLKEDGAPPKDYKFFVFNGKAKMFVIDSDRSTGHSRSLFTINGKFLNIKTDRPIPQKIPRLPFNLKKMTILAEKLAKDFDFARIDFYESNKKIFFGEITHYPWGCMAPFYPEEFDLKLGNLLEI